MTGWLLRWPWPLIFWAAARARRELEALEQLEAAGELDQVLDELELRSAHK